jgi:UDP-N-acetylglucosamine 2-epimerase (non-hydrolysing)
MNERLRLPEGVPYLLSTIHRPSNVDDPDRLLEVFDILSAASNLAPVLFVAHPRTRDRLQQLHSANKLREVDGDIPQLQPGVIYLLPPLPYLQFLSLLSKCKAVLTDSGGIQEESTFLGIPCLTLRENTERPVTVEAGSNEIVGLDEKRILLCLSSIMADSWKRGSPPPLWDGRAAERVGKVLKETFRLS